MASLQVTCITRQSHPNPHEGISHLGGSNWYWTRDQVIRSIEQKVHAFYTHVQGVSTWIGVVDGPNGKYLRTYADHAYNDNLLALPACPAR